MSGYRTSIECEAAMWLQESIRVGRTGSPNIRDRRLAKVARSARAGGGERDAALAGDGLRRSQRCRAVGIAARRQQAGERQGLVARDQLGATPNELRTSGTLGRPDAPPVDGERGFAQSVSAAVILAELERLRRVRHVLHELGADRLGRGIVA